MSIEKFFRRWFRPRDPEFEAAIDSVWVALGSVRESTKDIPDVEWVRLSSWTSIEGDVGGVVIGGEKEGVQLFISRDRGANDQGELTGYSISRFQPGYGIKELWNTGISTNNDSNLRNVVKKFEYYLNRLLYPA